MNSQSPLATALEHYQRGDLQRAEAIGRQLLAHSPSDHTLNALLGMITAQTGRYGEAVSFLRVALARDTANLTLRTGLAFSLANLDKYEEAKKVAAGYSVPQLQRITAFCDQRLGRITDAIAGYRHVLSEFPTDVESWSNLGVLLTQTGEIEAAVEALQHAIGLSPQPTFFISLSRALALGERHDERRVLLREAVGRDREHAALLVELGLAERAAGDLVAAEAAYQRALKAAPDDPNVYLEYGMMLESLSRLEDLAGLVREARSRIVRSTEIDFIEAWLLKRTGKFNEALLLAENSGHGINEARRWQLIGELTDRLGLEDRAVKAFSMMNRIDAQTPAAQFARMLDLPGKVKAQLKQFSRKDLITSPYSGSEFETNSPIFLVGFPRSGTTLLDTILMSLPELLVLEEMPMMDQVERLVIGAQLPSDLSADQARELRASYFKALHTTLGGTDASRIIVDKFPLHMIRVNLIHAIFPDARFIFVQRHPLDVILSCFMARFQTNRASVHFYNLEDAARLYDLAMQSWTRALELQSPPVHYVRYERMIGDVESEIRPLLKFLGVPWRDDVLDHQKSAAGRTQVPTASYAQVTEPIYTRAAGRWLRYRRFLEPVIPIIAPWAERMNYSI